MKFSKDEYDRLAGIKARKTEARTNCIKRMREMRDESDRAWDDARHAEYTGLIHDEMLLKTELTDIQSSIDAMERMRPMDTKRKNSVLERWVRGGDNGITAEEKAERIARVEAHGLDVDTANQCDVIPFGPEITGNWTQADVDKRTAMLGEGAGFERGLVRDRYNAPTQPGDTGLKSTITEPIDLHYYQPLTAYGNALPLFTQLHTPHGNDMHFFVAPDDTALATGPTANVLTSQTENALPDTWDKLTISAQMYTTGFMDYSRYNREDVQFSVYDWIMGVAMRRVGRKLEQQAANGTGAVENPRGFMTASTDFNQAAGGGAVFRWGDSIDIEHSIEYAYLFGMEAGLHGYGAMPGKTCYVTSWPYMAVFKKMVDADNRPLYLPNIHTRDVFDLNGYPIHLCHEFATANQANGNNKKPLVFGNFGQMVSRWAGAGFVIERFYDSSTALNNTERFMGRFRWGAGIVGPYDGTKNSATMKSKSLKTLVLKT